MAAAADTSTINNKMILEQALRTRSNMLFPCTGEHHLPYAGSLLANNFIPLRHEEGTDITSTTRLALARLANNYWIQEEAFAAAASVLTFAHQQHHRTRINSSILQMPISGPPNSSHPMPRNILPNVNKLSPPAGLLDRELAFTLAPPIALTTTRLLSAPVTSTMMIICNRQREKGAALFQQQRIGKISISGDKSAADATPTDVPSIVPVLGRKTALLYSKVHQAMSPDRSCMTIARKNEGLHSSSHPSSSCDVGKAMKSVHVDKAALESLGLSCLERRLNKTPHVDASVFRDPSPDVVSTYRRGRGSNIEPFPEKLYRMLVESTKEGKEHIASFLSHGRAFGIHKPEEFVNEIMPKYFKSNRLSSFQRQLNIYGFGRINTGPDAGGYYHELFLRRRPALCIHISRVGIPQQGIKRKRGAKTLQATLDPYFYSMSPILLVGVENKTDDE